MYNYNLNVQESLGGSMILQVGDVGSQGRRLRALLDVNQAGLGSGGANSTRPSYAQHPSYGVIHQIQGIGTKNDNSLQALLRMSSCRSSRTRRSRSASTRSSAWRCSTCSTG